MSLSGKVGAVFVNTNDAPFSFADEVTTENVDYTRYNITDTTKRYWDRNTPVTVKVNGSVISSGFETEHCGGVIVFTTPLTEFDVVTVSGKYIDVSQSGGFFNWSLDLENEVADVTTFQSNGWKEQLSTIKGFSASAEKYWGDSNFVEKLGTEVVIVLYVDAGVNQLRYEGFGLISSDGIESDVTEVINESIEIQGTDKLYYREG